MITVLISTVRGSGREPAPRTKKSYRNIVDGTPDVPGGQGSRDLPPVGPEPQGHRERGDQSPEYGTDGAQAEADEKGSRVPSAIEVSRTDFKPDSTEVSVSYRTRSFRLRRYGGVREAGSSRSRQV